MMVISDYKSGMPGDDFERGRTFHHGCCVFRSKGITPEVTGSS